MKAKIIDGKKLAADTRRLIAGRVAELKAGRGVTPGLAVILVGEDPASVSYVTAKEKACAEAGMASREIRLPATVSGAGGYQHPGPPNRLPTEAGTAVVLLLLTTTAVRRGERTQWLARSGRPKTGPWTSRFRGGQVAARRAGESWRRAALTTRVGGGLALMEQLPESGAGAGIQMRKFEVATRSEKWRCS